MRTTVDVDQRLLVAARQKASTNRTSLSQVVEEALRAYLTLSEEPECEPFRLLTFGEPGGRHPGPREIALALSAEEDDRHADHGG